MGKLTFKGGVHPFDGKKYTKDKPVEELFPGKELVFPLSQHIGAPAKPIVKKGDYVLEGQLIAESGGFISANIHSSVSGTVKAIEARYVATGAKVESIIIENDEKYETVDYKSGLKPLEELTCDDIRAIIKDAGIVGMGGAGFPTNVKLTPKNIDAIDTIIVNGAECEPYLTSDYRRMVEEPEKVIEGLKIVLKLFEKAKGYIAVEDNKPEAIKALKEHVKEEDRINVVPVKTKYPQGGERTLVYAVTGRQLNSSMLPADLGCVVQNVDTIFAVYNAVVNGIPLIKRIMTVTGDGIKEPKNLLVRIGTDYKLLLEACGGFDDTNIDKMISGGPMMGFAMSSIDVPVVKGSSSLLVLKKDYVSEYEESPCIRCGRCIEVCPGRVMPVELSKFAARGDVENFVKYNGMECCECGFCSYICPAKRHLTQRIKSMRKQVLASRKK